MQYIIIRVVSQCFPNTCLAAVQAQVKKAEESGVKMIELHTGKYTDSKTKKQRDCELKRIYNAARLANRLGLFVAAGHGLNYDNIKRVAEINYIEEFNIGHSIISRAVFVGLPKAIQEMRKLID